MRAVVTFIFSVLICAASKPLPDVIQTGEDETKTATGISRVETSDGFYPTATGNKAPSAGTVNQEAVGMVQQPQPSIYQPKSMTLPPKPTTSPPATTGLPTKHPMYPPPPTTTTQLPPAPAISPGCLSSICGTGIG